MSRTTSSSRAESSSARGDRAVGRSYLTAALMLVVVVIFEFVGIRVYFREERARTEKMWARQLSQVATDRCSALEDWVKEQEGNARLVAAYPTLRHLVNMSAAELAKDVENHAHMVGLIEQMAANYEYDGAHLFDSKGAPIMSMGRHPQLDDGTVAIARQVLAAGKPAVDFQRTPQGRATVAIAAPVFVGDVPGQPAKGVVVIDADPNDWLYPLLRAEEVPTKTAEALLVRRDGRSVLFLSPLRQRAGAPLTIRLPLTTRGFAARAAIEGRRDFDRYFDYRGVPVFAVMREVRGTGWRLVVKVDQSEVLGPAAGEVAKVAWGVVAATLLAALAFLTLLHARRVRHTSALEASEARFAHLFDHANDAILLIERSGRIIAANLSATVLYGRTESELLALNLSDLQVAKEGHSADPAPEWSNHGEGVVFETTHVRSDGTPLPVEVSSRVVQAKREPVLLSIIRNVRERKAAEERIRTLNRVLLTISEINQLIVHEQDRARLLDAACRILVERGEFVMAWIGRADRESGRIVPLASAGADGGILQSDHLRFEGPDILRPAGVALRDGRAVIIDDWNVEPDNALWRQIGLPRGYFASAALPLRSVGSVWGVLSVHAATTNVFNREVVSMMAELADDVSFAIDMIEIRQRHLEAEKELAESEERLRFAVEATNDGLWDVDLTTGSVYLSARACEILGYRSDEMEHVAQIWSDLVCPEDLPLTMERLNAHLNGDAPLFSVEQRLRTKENGWVWVLARGKVVARDVDGKALRMTGTHTDITMRRKAEEELQHTQQRFKALIELAADGVILFDAQGGVIYISPSASRILGYNAADLAGRTAFDFIHPDDVSNIRAVSNELLYAPGDIRTGAFRSRHRDGRWLCIEFTLRNALNEPAVRAIIANFRDVTEQRRSEEEQRLLAAAVDQAAESIIITDRAGRIQYVNPAFERTTGYGRDEAIGQKPSILKSGKHDDAFYARLWETISSGEIWTGRFTNRRKDGSLLEEEGTLSPVRNNAREIVNFVAVKRDVTQELILENQLRQAQKMEAIGILAGGIAHDFNNILQAMLMQTHLIERAGGDKEQIDLRREELVRQISRGKTIARELLLFARRDDPNKELLDLNDVIRSAATLVRRLVRENVALSVRTDPQPLPVFADHGQIDQIIMNLVVNAADAMPDGGRLSIDSGRDSAGMCWFSVADTGHGISVDARDHVFEPFFTTKAKGKGTGLGLSVVHGIVTRHSGTIEFSDRPGGGTVFRVSLPAAKSAQLAAGRPSDIRAELPIGNGQRVLVVEDEEGVRSGLTHMLNFLGYEPRGVPSGEAAIALDAKTPYDVLLTDLVLAGMSGQEVSVILKQKWPALRVLLMSGYAGNLENKPAGAAEERLLQKPFDLETLAAEMQKILSR